MKHLLCTALIALGLGSATPLAQAQTDPGKLLGGFLQGLMRQGTGNAAPAAPGLGLSLGGSQNAESVDVGQTLQWLSQATQTIDEPKEQEIGRHLAAVLLGAKPLVKDRELQLYINRLGRWIALQSARPQLAWTFGVLDDAGYNAFAAPGGFVFVTRGLVERMRSESELAAVLAHEVSHVVQKHHLKALQTAAKAGLLGQLVSTQVAKNEHSGLQQQLLSLGREVYARGLDQSDELEADRLGVVLATASGFDPFGLPLVLQQLGTMRADDPAFTLLFSTHPAAGLRLSTVEQAMGSRFDDYPAVPARPVPWQAAAGGTVR